MSLLFIVNHPRDWPHELPGVTVVAARAFLTDPAWTQLRGARVVNLCKSYRYQSRGYYVSLLSEARGHRVLPSVRAIEDFQNPQLLPLLTGGLDELVQRSLGGLDDDRFELDVWFGHDPDGRHEALAKQLHELLQAPLLKAVFARDAGAGGWRIDAVRALCPSEVPAERRPLMALAARRFAGAGCRTERHANGAARQPSIAILRDPESSQPPSNDAAIERFVKAARMLGMQAEVIGRHDIDRLPEFDALFIRDTTNVNHYSYRFARRAAAEGLVVMDDPDSILKCTNKVYLHELLTRHRLPTPRTLMVHRGNVDRVAPALGLPVILKQPDSAFSLGVKKARTLAELHETVQSMLQKSELIIAQQWLPTAFDWRVGVLDRRPLFVCKYFMAPGHWQVIKREGRTGEGGEPPAEGMTMSFTVGEVPEAVIRTAMRAADLIGDGFYGVDLKQVGDRCYVIEINDNPNVDAGNEDGVLGEALYREVMGVFRRRVLERQRVAHTETGGVEDVPVEDGGCDPDDETARPGVPSLSMGAGR